jgi:hypothetical protein
MTSYSDPIQYLLQEISQSRRVVLNNGLYYRLTTLPDLRRFMEHHVFAVWDFMSLLKALQRELTSVEVLWQPTANPATRRLINKIVLEEESGLNQHGQAASQFEMYLQAMDECGANTVPIRKLLAALAEGYSVRQALQAAQVPDTVQQFVETTFDIIESGQPHVIASAFTFGRGGVIPDMFRNLVGELRSRFPGHLDTFTFYLDRQIELDGEVDAPLAQQIVREMCGDDPQRWQECQQVAIRCMESRMVLWDGIKPAKKMPKVRMTRAV